MAREVVDLTPLATCPSLTSVSVARTAVEDLSPLANLRMLDSVDVFRSKVTDVGPLMGLSQLTYLQLTKGVKYKGAEELQQIARAVTHDCESIALTKKMATGRILPAAMPIALIT